MRCRASPGNQFVLLTIGALPCVDVECTSQLQMQRVIWEVLAKGQATAGEGNILARINIARDTSSGGYLRKMSEQSTAQLLVST
jgi:hypothetical protein